MVRSARRSEGGRERRRGGGGGDDDDVNDHKIGIIGSVDGGTRKVGGRDERPRCCMKSLLTLVS